MSSSTNGKPPFAIIQFDDGTIEIIRTDWTMHNEKGEILGTLFPPTSDQRVFNNYLKENTIPDESWSDDGDMWAIKKIFCFAHTLEDAKQMLILHINLSEVETDPEKNQLKLKKSRHSRCKKSFDTSDSDNNIETGEKKKQLKSKKCPSSRRNKISDSEDESDDEVEPFQPKMSFVQNTENDESLKAKSRENSKKSVPTIRSISIISASNSENLPTGNEPDELPEAEGKENSKKAVPRKTTKVSADKLQNLPVNSRNESELTDKLTKDSSRKRSGDAYSEFMFEKVVKMDSMLEMLCKEKGATIMLPDSFLNKKGDLKCFPIKEIEKIQEIEAKLLSTNLFDKLFNAMVNVGRLGNLSMTITEMLKNTLSFAVGKQFSFLGRSGKKKAFKILKMNEAVQKASLILFPGTDMASINAAISSWLTHCTIREHRANGSEQPVPAEVVDLDREP